MKPRTPLVLTFVLVFALSCALASPAAHAGIPWVDSPSEDGVPWIDGGSLWHWMVGALGLASPSADRGSGMVPDGADGDSGPSMDPMGLRSGGDAGPGLDPIGLRSSGSSDGDGDAGAGIDPMG